MTNIFTDSRIRLSQAKRHIIVLKREIGSFLDNYKKRACVIENDPSDSNYFLHKIKITESPAEEIVAYATDAIDNLRAALDLAWWNLAVTAGFISPNADGKFPFADNAMKFEGLARRGLIKFPQEILSVLMRFKPYKGGDDLLWALNRICATNKHRLLPLKIIRYRMIEGQLTKWGPGEVPNNMGWDNGKKEIIFFRSHRHTIINTHIKVSLDITFHESVEVVGGKPVIATLNTLVDKVEQILLTLEDTARGLGVV
jgi:hypothetical protein